MISRFDIVMKRTMTPYRLYIGITHVYILTCCSMLKVEFIKKLDFNFDKLEIN